MLFKFLFFFDFAVMLFEGRARYLICYLPCFSLLAAVGLGNVRRGLHGIIKERIDDDK